MSLANRGIIQNDEATIRLIISNPDVKVIEKPESEILDRIIVGFTRFDISFQEEQHFSCHMTNRQSSPDLIESIRDFVKNTYSAHGYVGFSENIDQVFDDNSVYFFVKDKNEKLVAVQRVIMKKEGHLLPFETANILDLPNKHYSVKETNVAEITSFCYTNIRAVSLLISSMAYWARLNQIQTALALVDIESKSLSKFYHKIGWKYSSRYNKAVFFPTYGKIDNNDFLPTRWRILELDRHNICRIAKGITNYQIQIN